MLDRLLNYLPFIVFIGAMLLAAVSVPADGEEIDRTIGAVFVMLLGASSLLFGLNAVRKGAVRLKRTYADRSERPVAFWMNVLLFRVGIGLVLVGAGLWLLWTEAD